ncbi:MAG: hypothetical protein LBU46_07490 [Candidatus Accumulibacter sp.]|jgi:hypothetical protein|nr:hypothetical protein [Accumulibacter sp.]
MNKNQKKNQKKMARPKNPAATATSPTIIVYFELLSLAEITSRLAG